MFRERGEYLFVRETKPEKMKKDAIENVYNLPALEKDLRGRGLSETARIVGDCHLLSLKDLFEVLGSQENIHQHLQEVRTIFNKHKKRNE